MHVIKKASDKFYKTFDENRGWPVPEEWQKELYNYVILGLSPGSFHTSVYANDLVGAAQHSHSMNTWSALSQMCKWLSVVAPYQCWGSYEKVEKWLKLSPAEHKRICEEQGLLYTEQEVTWNILKDKVEN